MLVLSRKDGERIRLGDSVVITILSVGQEKVRIGIEAPSDLLVLREELEARKTDPTVVSSISSFITAPLAGPMSGEAA